MTTSSSVPRDARAEKAGSGTPSRREVFTLAAVLAATALTAGAAVAGLSRTAPPAPAVPVVSQIVQPAPTPQPRSEPGD